MSYIFGGNTGLSYEQLQQQRRAMDRRSGQRYVPKNIGEGLSALGHALGTRISRKRLEQAEVDRQGRAKNAFSAFQTILGGGATNPPAITDFNAALGHSESGGQYNIQNDEGYTGKYQFGQDRLDDFNRANNAQFTIAQLQQNPQLQEQVQNWHVADIDQFAKDNNLMGYVGQDVGGTTLSQDSLRAMAHLGGKGGMKRYLETGGRYNPADSNGTRLSDYAAKFAGQQAPRQQSVDPRVFELMTDPSLSPSQRSVMGMLYEQKLRQQAGMDPLKALKIEKMQRELNAPAERKILKGADGYQYYQDDGSRVLPNVEQAPGYQMLSADQVQQMGLPEGAYQQGPKGRISQIGGSGTNVTVNNGAGETAFAKTTGNELAKSTNELAVAGDDARRNLGRIDRLEGLLSTAPTGVDGAWRQVASNMGFGELANASDIQAAQALINSLVPEQRPAGSGPMSDADLELFKQSLPRIINTKDGNKKIIDTMRGIAQYDVQRGEIARNMQLGKMTPEQAFEAYSTLKNPLDWVNGSSPSEASDLSELSDDELMKILESQ